MDTSNTDNNNSRLSGRLIDFSLNEAQVASILAARAAALAQAPEQDNQSAVSTQYVIFCLSGERYGLNVDFVEEIQPLKDLTLIPCTPDFVIGAVNIRGGIIPVIDIKKFFGVPETETGSSKKVMVIKAGDMRFAILADLVEEVLDFASEEIEPQLATLSGAHEEFIKGVSQGQTIILDIEALANDRRMIIHEDV